MSQDPNSQDGKKEAGEVDIDNLEVEILVLAKNAKALASACAFLTRRGWPTTVMTNLSKGIEYIAEKRPDFVLVSLNHPSPAVAKLPDLITQTFNLVSIGFIESSDAPSTQKLNQAKLRYKVSGAPSGPNFHRTVRRILAERFNVKIDDKSGAPAAEDDKAGGTVTVKGNKTEEAGDNSITVKNADGTTVIRGKKVHDSTEAGYVPKHGQAGENADGGFSADDLARELQKAQSSGGNQNTLSGLVQTDGQVGASAPGFAQGAQGPAATGMVQSGGQDSKSASGHSSGGKGAAPAANASTGEESITNGTYSMTKTPRKRLKQLSGNEPSDGVGGNLLFGKEATPKPSSGAPNEAAEVKPDVAAQPDLIGMLKKSLFGEDGVDSVETTGQSLLEKAVELGLGEICQKNPTTPPVPLKTANRVAVFPVDSGSMPGYLVLALETIEADDQKKFINECDQVLTSAFQKIGVAAKLETGFWLDLPDVPFDAWADHASLFSFRLDHGGAEMGVAFFASNSPLPKAQVKAETGMYTLEVENISTDQPITFKAYLHLQKNQKYFLYLRNGRRLQPEQKQRLKDKQVKDVFMKSVDIENVRMFLALVFLRESIKGSQEAA